MVSPLCRPVSAWAVNLFLPNLGFGRLVSAIHVPVVPPERLLHTAKVFTNSLHCNRIPLPIPDTGLHTCCSDTVVDESKQQKNPQIEKQRYSSWRSAVQAAVYEWARGPPRLRLGSTTISFPLTRKGAAGTQPEKGRSGAIGIGHGERSSATTRLKARVSHVPVVLPDRLLHTAKVFTNSLHCNRIPLPIPDNSRRTPGLRKIQFLGTCSESHSTWTSLLFRAEAMSLGFVCHRHLLQSAAPHASGG
jgi:hypothetical protein